MRVLFLTLCHSTLASLFIYLQAGVLNIMLRGTVSFMYVHA
jgi:hypothetical protein